MKPIPITEAEQTIGLPAQEWHGKCHEIAIAFIQKELVLGRPCYGHYLGYVSPEGFWAKRRGLFIQHGWVLTPARTIVDPTRWSFENVEPYVAMFEEGADEYAEYDWGGNQWRTAMLDPECPEPDAEPTHRLPVGDECRDFLWEEFRFPELNTIRQLMWLANHNPNQLGVHVLEVYRALDQMGNLAFVPIDNQTMVGIG